MVIDRDYMKDPFEPERSAIRIDGNKILMITLVVAFFGQMMLKKFAGVPVDQYVGLRPDDVIGNFFIWQPVTYMFFHPTSLYFIIFVLIGLFFFGPIVESMWGRKKYLQSFLAAGVFAALVYTPIAYIFRLKSRIVLGAIAPVLSILVIASMARPNMKVLLFFVVPIKMKYMVWLFVGLDVFVLLKYGYAGIHQSIPHLAGAFFGFLYYRYHRTFDRLMESLESEEPPPPPSSKPEPKRSESSMPHSQRIDEILDKINREGLNSLTSEERKLLEEASEELKGDEQYDPFQQKPR